MYLFFCLIPLVLGTEVHENVIFEKVNDISTTRSQWRIALLLDISVFRNAMCQEKYTFAAILDVAVLARFLIVDVTLRIMYFTSYPLFTLSQIN